MKFGDSQPQEDPQYWNPRVNVQIRHGSESIKIEHQLSQKKLEEKKKICRQLRSLLRKTEDIKNRK